LNTLFEEKVIFIWPRSTKSLNWQWNNFLMKAPNQKSAKISVPSFGFCRKNERVLISWKEQKNFGDPYIENVGSRG